MEHTINQSSPKGRNHMLEQVENKIQELKKLRAEEYYKKKEEDLKAWGLTTKVDGKKVTPIIVTDEEYEELVRASNGVGKVGRNSVANMLSVFSWVILVIGAIAGAVAASLSKDYAVIAFTISIGIAAIVAVIFTGLAEAIKLLQQLLDGRNLEKPDASLVKKPKIKKVDNAAAAPAPAQAQAPLYVPYPVQGQNYAYPYPVYAAPQPVVPGQEQPVAAYTPEKLQAYYQQPVTENIAEEVFNGK